MAKQTLVNLEPLATHLTKLNDNFTELYDGKEDNTNKKTTMTGNTTSNTFYLSAKAIYDWATATFQPLSAVLTNITLIKPTINGSVQGITTDTDGSTITFNMASSNIHTVTLAGNRTLALSNVSVGQVFTIRLQQDATGSRTVTWFSTIKWSGGSTPTLTTTPNKADLLIFVCTGPGTYDGAIAMSNL